MPTRPTLQERFDSRISGADPECVLWMGRYDHDGYGRITVMKNGKASPQLAHRIAWTLAGRGLVTGMTLDHLCHTNNPSCTGGRECLHRRCVNVNHLEQVTPRTNNARRWLGWRTMFGEGNCSHGHPLSDAVLMKRRNSIYAPCTECANASARRYKRRVRGSGAL
jgi:hypothetical protein